MHKTKVNAGRVGTAQASERREGRAGEWAQRKRARGEMRAGERGIAQAGKRGTARVGERAARGARHERCEVLLIAEC